MISFNFQLLRDHIQTHQTSNLISSRQKLSYIMDVEEATLSRIFSGEIKNSVGVLNLYKICKVLGSKMEDYIIEK